MITWQRQGSGQAGLVYGEARLTKDIDITLGASLDRLAEVLQIVAAIGLEDARLLLKKNSQVDELYILSSRRLKNSSFAG